MAEAKVTADSASRLDHTLPSTTPACPQRRDMTARASARVTA
jgi:hypothetical protein